MSSLFKTQVQTDLASVFLNPNEFAEPHNINGVDGVICVVDTELTRSLRPGLSRFDGTEKETLTLFISEANWQGKSPAYNQFVTVDQARYRIKNVDLFNGLYELSLEGIK